VWKQLGKPDVPACTCSHDMPPGMEASSSPTMNNHDALPHPRA